MKFRKNKKGFTIVELVIVIAVIGVLTAVLVPTFINLTQRANEASDQTLVKNLNTILVTKEQDLGYKTTTYQKVIDIVDEAGYKVPNLVAKSGEDLFWNQKSNRFYLGSKKDTSLPDYTYWTIKDALDGTETYSVYAGLNFNAKTVNNLKAGFDVGSHTDITDINYVGSDAKQDGVTFRVQQDYFTNISNNNNYQDEVKVYGYANRIYSEKSGQQSLYINEHVATLEIKEGHVVIAEGVKIGSLVFKATSENNFDKIVVEIPNVQEQVGGIYRSNVSTNLPENVKVEVATIKTAKASETYFLEGNGTIDDANLLVSTDGTVEHAYPVEETTASDAAKAIANAKVGDVVVDTGMNDEEIQNVVEDTQSQKQNEEAEKKAEEEGIDFSSFEARIGLVGYESFRTAIAQAKAGDTVALLKDVTITSVIMINKNITIEGNGFCVTDNNSSGGRTFRVNTNGVHFAIRNLELNGNGKSQRGVQVDSYVEPVYLSIKNCDFHDYTYYTINFCLATTVDLTLVDSTVQGWAAINAYGHGNVFNIKGCTLIGLNDKSKGSSNNFATICLEGDSTGQTEDHSSDYIINVEDSIIVASQTKGNVQTIFGFNPLAENSIINFANCTYDVGTGCCFGYNYGTGSGLTIDGEVIELPHGFFDINLEE